MNLAETLVLIRNAGIPEYKYVTDGGLGSGECYGIERSSLGWIVYYSERGGKTVLERHTTEDEAAAAFLRFVMNG